MAYTSNAINYYLTSNVTNNYSTSVYAVNTKGKLRMDCPFCGTGCYAEYVDIGVGQQQATPFRCDVCYAVQMSPYENSDAASGIERFAGWWQGQMPPQDELRLRFKMFQELQEEIKCSKEDIFLVSPLLHWLEARE